MMGAVWAGQQGGGDGVVYDTFNPLDKQANLTLSNGDLTATDNLNNYSSVRGKQGKTTGKWSVEFYANNFAAAAQSLGVADATADLAELPAGKINYGTIYTTNGRFYRYGDTSYQASGHTGFPTGTYIGFIIDFDRNEVTIYKNGVAGNTILLSTTSAQGSPYAGPALYPVAGTYYNGDIVTINTGQTAFAYPLLPTDGWFE